uniref:hypothetical protein n=1 Tax=Robertkochia aurantiaca TaxID=2873700 RepID=UPI001CCF49B6
DINALANTFLKIIMPNSNGSDLMYNVDGTGGLEKQYRSHEWLNLGKYNQEVQNKIKNEYITGIEDENIKVYGTQAIGIAALNAKILSDGSPVYPEQP